MHRNDKQNVLKRAVLAAAVSSAIFMAPVAAHAAGMGKITVLSALGQPLRAELDITASRDEMPSLAARVAPVEAFRQANVEYAGVLSTIKFVLDKRPDGRPYFRIQTERAVNEPFIDFLVELSWSSGRLVREYAFLLDPPDLMQGETATAPAVSAPTVQPPAEAAAPAAEPITPLVREGRQVPGAGPAHKMADEGAGAADGAHRREVKPGDTLSKIAIESAPSGVTLDQMLVALFNSNRDAFIGGNMNRMRAGKILTVPGVEQAAALSAGEARKIVVAQSADFNAYRNSLAASVASQAPREEQTQQSSSGKIAPRVEEKTPIAAGQDKLQLSRSDAQAKAGGKFSEEDIVAREKALHEANSRIADLEKNLADLKKLADLKSQAAADAQKAAPGTTAVPATESPALAVPAQPPAAPAVVDAPAGPAISATAAAPATEEKPKAKPKKKIVPPPPPPEPSFIEDSPLLVYGGSGAILALLGFLGFRTWKRKRDAGSAQSVRVSDMAPGSIFGAATASENLAAASPAPTDFGHSTIEAVDTSKEGVDPIQEAEVYMAYGRDGQAEEILVDAMRNTPGNLAVYLKLLEIYAGRKTVPQFNEVAGDLHSRTGGSGPEWDKAAALGRSLDPANPLYGGSALAASAAHDQPPASVEAPMGATMVMEAPPAQQGPDTTPVAAAQEKASALDFDFDLGLDAPAPTASSATAPAAAAVEKTASDIDFDLGIETSPVAETAASAPVENLDINFDMTSEAGNSIDFDIVAPAAAKSTGSGSASAASAGGEPALDFDFDLGESAAAPLEPPSPPLDLSLINLDLGDPAPAATAGGDSAEVATKLELAQAYEEMGDRDGARELLEEVVSEGSAAQQEAARAKLAQLG